MIGKSVYISNLDDFIIDDNVDLYFTSFHIAEEFNDEYKYKVKDLLCRLKDNNKTIVCVISPRGLKQLNYSSLKDCPTGIAIQRIRKIVIVIFLPMAKVILYSPFNCPKGNIT